MLNAGVLKYDATGRIRNTTAAPTEWNAGIPMNQGLLCAIAAAPDYRQQGLPFMNTGHLAIQSAVPAHWTQGGIGIGASGGVAVLVNAGTINARLAGLPFVDSRLSLATAEAPTTTRSFSNGFSGGFQ